MVPAHRHVGEFGRDYGPLPNIQVTPEQVFIQHEGHGVRTLRQFHSVGPDADALTRRKTLAARSAKRL